MEKVQAFEDALGYAFKDRALAEEAMTHSSWLSDHPGSRLKSNERLAFIGDAVLGLAVGELVASANGTKGDMTQRRAKYVNNEALAGLADKLVLPINRGGALHNLEEATKARAGLYEAAVGAVFLDASYETARRMVGRHVHRHLGLPT